MSEPYLVSLVQCGEGGPFIASYAGHGDAKELFAKTRRSLQNQIRRMQQQLDIANYWKIQYLEDDVVVEVHRED